MTELGADGSGTFPAPAGYDVQDAVHHLDHLRHQGDGSWANILRAGAGSPVTPLHDEAPRSSDMESRGAPLFQGHRQGVGSAEPDPNTGYFPNPDKGMRPEGALGQPSESWQGWPRPPPGYHLMPAGSASHGHSSNWMNSMETPQHGPPSQLPPESHDPRGSFIAGEGVESWARQKVEHSSQVFPGQRNLSGSASPLPPLNEWYKGSFRDAISMAKEDMVASYPYTASVPPPLPIVGGLAQSLQSTVAVDPPPGRVVGLASQGFPTLDGLDGMITDGTLDTTYIIQEAARRKRDVDRALDIQLREVENEFLQRGAAIKQQAEHHTKLAEQQIGSQMRNQIQHVSAQAEAKGFEVTRRAKEEKQRLGHDASQAIARVVERNKAAALHHQMRATETMHHEQQQVLADQTHALRHQIALQTRKRAEEIDRTKQMALSSLFLAPAAH